MHHQDQLAEQFEAHRSRLHGIALRMLGSSDGAHDAVQTTWLRLAGIDDEPENLGGWLTTVVSRVAIDMLRAGNRRADTPLDDQHDVTDDTPGPGEVAELADSVGAALWVVLDTLSPSERLAFVLRESFDLPYRDIAPILGRSETATKQLAHRARGKVRGTSPPAAADRTDEQREVIEAFLGAARSGELAQLIELLDPTVDVSADPRAVQMGSPPQVDGSEAVGQVFSGRALGAQPARIDGVVGFAWATEGTLRVVWDVVVTDGVISHINMLADPDTLSRLDIELL